jgi:prepilin-type N-terminal cleavage/methylation domain-containing protein
MLRQRWTRRGGFTLPEVLVTIAIVSVLAAIVVPTVTSQIGKGDESRFQSTIGSLRTGITAFVSDTRRFPSAVSHLFNPITAVQTDLAGSAYGANTVSRWRGPYGSGAMALGGTLPMGLAFMQDALVDSVLTGMPTSIVATLDIAQFTTLAPAARLDTLVDAGNGNNVGVLQWEPAACNPCTRMKLQLMGSR